MSNKYVDEIMASFEQIPFSKEAEKMFRNQLQQQIRQAQLDVLEDLYKQRQAIKMYNGGFEDVVILPYITEKINQLEEGK